MELRENTARHKDAYQKTLYDYSGYVWVKCPKCSKKALVKASEVIKNHPFIDEVRATCTHCGFSDTIRSISRRKDPKQKKGNVLIYGSPVDPYFHFDLWYCIPYKNFTFWAYNEDHLQLIGHHVSALLRERNGYPHQVRSIGARLPRWMTSGKHRKEILQLIQKLISL